jgi:hypothetical protein
MSNIFSSLGETVIKTLIQMATQALITKAIMASFGGGAGGMFGSLLVEQVELQVVELRCKASDRLLPLMLPVVSTIRLHFPHTAAVYTALRSILPLRKGRACSVKRAGSIMPLTRGADGSLGVRAVGRESPAVQDAARQIEAQPRIAVGVDARSTFSGQPDDITMQAVERRNALWNTDINTLTAEVNNPRRNSDGLFTPIYSPKNHDRPARREYSWQIFSTRMNTCPCRLWTGTGLSPYHLYCERR